MLIEVECMSYNIRATGGEVPLSVNRRAIPRADDVNAVTILVGTMTGTAELVANDMRDAIAATGREAEVLPMDDLDPSVFERPGVFVVCSSTYGQGDVPDNAMKFYEALGQAAPDLGHVRYGVFALGDRTYTDTFCHGGQRFDTLLTRLGAARLGDVMRHDASSGTVPETIGLEWVQAWLADLTTVESKAA
jgi:MioC protein